MAWGFELLFGDGRNALVETAGMFREHKEHGAAREAALKQQVLSQYAAEFATPRRGVFDRAIDGVNRLPRPMLAFGTLGLFVSAMVDPVWFASRMQGIALVPEPLWWLMGAIVSFYFGARHQAKSQEFQRSAAEVARRAPDVLAAQERLDTLRPMRSAHSRTQAERPAPLRPAAAEVADNPALAEWLAASG